MPSLAICSVPHKTRGLLGKVILLSAKKNAVVATLAKLDTVAPKSASVFSRGESGTGLELVTFGLSTSDC